MERLTSPNINVDPDTDRFLHATIGGKEIDWKQCRDSTLNVLINGPTSNGFGKDIFRKMARDLYGRPTVQNRRYGVGCGHGAHNSATCHGGCSLSGGKTWRRL